MACLDTTLLVDLLRSNQLRKRRALDKIDAIARRGELVVTTCVNLAELYVGVELSDNPQRDYARLQDVLNQLDSVLEFDDPAARLFGRIAAHLQRIGRPTGETDMIIAATAIGSGHSLVTQNPSHFADIEGLAVETY